MFQRFMSPYSSKSVKASPTRPRYVADPATVRESKSILSRRRFDNQSFSGKNKGLSKKALREKSTSGGPVENFLKRATIRNFMRDGIFPQHRILYVCGSTDIYHFAEMWKLAFKRTRPLVVAVDFEWAPNYDPKDHPNPQHPYRCYGVDVATFSTPTTTLVLHLAQYNEDRWGRPGPYEAKSKKNRDVCS